MSTKLKDRNRGALGLRGASTTLGGAGASLGNVPLLELLRAFKQIVVTGGAANAALTATGMAPGDLIIGAIAIGASPADLTDVTAATTITTANVIKSTTDTSSLEILVTYVDLHS